MTSLNAGNDSTNPPLLESVKKAAFVIGTALVTFVAARNSITWHCQKFWGASGDFWQAQWSKIFEFFGQDEYFLGVYGTTIFTVGSFWLLNSMFILIEFTGWPKFAQDYKVQEDRRATWSDFKKALKRVLFNQSILGIPVSIVTYYFMQWRGCNFGRELPSFHWVLWELFVYIWIEEIGFYYSHRLMHHPFLYKRIHKIHHEWTAPIGIVSIYAHPLEHVVSNLVPVMLGPIVCASHIGTAWLWYLLAIFSTTIAHSGYHFPFLPSPEAHDFHHLKFNNNFGTLGVLDRLHGTDAVFRRSKAYERHFMALSLVPVKSLYPDNIKKERERKKSDA